MTNIETLGQVFTPRAVAHAMLALKKNTGRTLEPSCGNGVFSNVIPSCVAIEVDTRYAPDYALKMDFFEYPDIEKFDTIIGNPPYVKFKNIRPETKALLTFNLLDRRSNLYLFFIEKAIRHLTDRGELIFITPRDFMKTTSSVWLNKWMYSQGTITHVIDLGDTKIFPTVNPNCIIWRFERGLFDREMRYAKVSRIDELYAPTWQKRLFVESEGHLMFSEDVYPLRLKDVASVKVGAVSGADDIYASEELGTTDFVYSETVTTGKTRKMLWVDPNAGPPSCLLPYKDRLIARKVRNFDESNWWHWGRGYPITDAPRVYVNTKTRHPRPFFLHECNNFDGSILAIFPHDPSINMEAFCNALNNVNWDQLGFVCNGRFIFSQKSLEDAPLPEHFLQFLNKE